MSLNGVDWVLPHLQTLTLNSNPKFDLRPNPQFQTQKKFKTNSNTV